MTTRAQEINALIVEMQTYVTIGDWDNAEATNHRIESLCRDDLNEMFGFVVTVPGTVYEFWVKQVEINKMLGGTPAKPQLGPDIDPITPDDEFSDHAILARHIKWMPGQSMTRRAMIQQLEFWRLEAVELGLGMCALKLMEAKEDLEDLGEPELPAQANNIVRECLIVMAEKKSQNIMAGRYGTRAVTRNEQPIGRVRQEHPLDTKMVHYTGCKGIVRSTIPHDEMPKDAHGNTPDILFEGRPAVIPERPSFGLNKEHYDITLQTNQSAVDEVNAQKLRTKTFVNIVPQEQAVRMVNDLQHLINITDDDAYAEALSNEVRRLSLFANGDVKSILDINFAWTYHE